jgi:hypothetical protein
LAAGLRLFGLGLLSFHDLFKLFFLYWAILLFMIFIYVLSYFFRILEEWVFSCFNGLTFEVNLDIGNRYIGLENKYYSTLIGYNICVSVIMHK